MTLDPLTKRLNVRLTEAEDAAVRDAAGASALSVSDYARRRILGHAVSSKADAGLRAELARTGALIKRFAVDVADRDACNRALTEVVEAARRIGRSS